MRVLTFLLTLSALSVFILAQTVAIIEADLAEILTQVTAISNGVTAFPNAGGTLTQALALHSSFGTATTKVNDTVSDIESTPGPISAADLAQMAPTVHEIATVIDNIIGGIDSKKSAFDALPIGGIYSLVKSDAVALQQAFDGVENALGLVFTP